MNRNELFLYLLQSVLWSREVELSNEDKLLLPEVLLLAQLHRVEALIAHSLISQSDLDDDNLEQQALQTKFMNFRNNQKVDDIVGKLGKVLEEGNQSAILLKGQGLAQCYEEPGLRSPGDIDLFAPDFDRVLDLFRKQFENKDVCISVDDELKRGEKHIDFMWDGVEVELHRRVIDHDRSVDSDAIIVWSREQLTSSVAGMILPPVTWNAFYIFYHLWHHYWFGGIGIRQLCDWVRFLHVNRESIDRELLERKLRSFGLMGEWRRFGAAAVNGLGLEEADMPFYRDGFRKQGTLIIDHVLQYGNFGKEGYARFIQRRTSIPVVSRFPLFGKLYTMTYLIAGYLREWRVSPGMALRHVWALLTTSFSL